VVHGIVKGVGNRASLRDLAVVPSLIADVPNHGAKSPEQPGKRLLRFIRGNQKIGNLT
jgi:hypothetical protein